MIRRFQFADRTVENNAGAHIVINSLVKSANIKTLIDRVFPHKNKKKNTLYTPYDAIMSLFRFKMLGGTSLSQFETDKYRLSHTSNLFRSDISYTTIKRWIKSVSTAVDTERVRKKGDDKTYKIYREETINNAIIGAVHYFGLLSKTEELVLDIDTTTINTKCKGSSNHYKNGVGYHNVIASINRIPVYFECRTGSVHAGLFLEKSVDRIVRMLRNRGYKIGAVRIDSAGYVKLKLEHYHKNLDLKFYVRAKVDESDALNQKKSIVVVSGKKMTVGVKYKNFGRLRCKYVFNRANKNEKLFATITNDNALTNAELIEKYCQRGVSEQVIRDIKNFGWEKMAFHDIEHNSPYFGICIFCFIMYKYVLKNYTEILSPQFDDYLNINMQPKSFRNKFLACDGIIINEQLTLLDTSRQHIYTPILNEQVRIARNERVNHLLN